MEFPNLAQCGAEMKIISNAIALCDELSGDSKKLRSKALRRGTEEYANAQKEALEAVRKKQTELAS